MTANPSSHPSPVERLIERLEGVRRGATGWMAKCPAHEDRQASLSLTEGDDGRALVYCHAGCATEAVLAALQLTEADLFERKLSVVPIRPRNRPKQGKLIYKIRDANGAVVALHVRSETENGKRFTWQLPDGRIGLNGTRTADLPLFGSEHATKWTRRRPIVITEGEKAAAALMHAGYRALGTVTGAATAPSPAVLSCLLDRDVILWPDADEAGSKHMALVAERLQGVALSVRVIEWPGAPEHGDAADAVTLGAELVEDLVRRATPDAAVSERRRSEVGRLDFTRAPAKNATVSAAALLEQRFAEPRWAIPSVLPEGLVLLVGGPKLGKSWMVLGWGCAIAAAGRAFGSIQVDAGEVLYLALEDTPRRLQTRLATILDDPTTASADLHLATEWARIDKGGLDQLAEWLEAHPRCRLVIIDTLARIRGPRKAHANLYDDDYVTMAALKRLADRHSVSVVVTHHDRKMKAEDPFDTVSGTQALVAAADTTLVLKRARGQADAVLHITGRDVEEAQHALVWSAAAGTWALTDPSFAHVGSERADILGAVPHVQPATPTEVAKWIKRPVGTVKRLMWAMGNDGQLVGGGRGGYALPTTQPTEPRERR